MLFISPTVIEATKAWACMAWSVGLRRSCAIQFLRICRCKIRLLKLLDSGTSIADVAGIVVGEREKALNEHYEH